MARDYPERLHHTVPSWVVAGSVFHVRIRAATEQIPPLTHPDLGSLLLDAVQRYHDTMRWWCRLAMLMPDHLHMLLSFPRQEGMVATVRDWKRGTARFQGVHWQSNFFDHRIRSPEELDKTWTYIADNPVAKGLVARADDWPWQWCAGGMR